MGAGGLPAPVGPTGPSGASGSGWLTPCRAATTGNITISTALNSGDTLDGVTLANGDRVLVKDQSTAADNGIYVVAPSPARATDADVTGEIVGGTCEKVQEGTVNADSEWVVTTDGTITIGSTGIAWARRDFDPGTWLTVGGTGVAFNTGWGNFGSGYQTAAYRKDSRGRVFLRGVTTRSSGVLTTMFTLPSGYRPSATALFAVSANGAFGAVEVRTDGTVVLTAGTATGVQIEGLAFDV